MTLRAVLVIINLCAWGALVALRGPLPESFFVERDTARQHGGFFLSSGDPTLVIAGRPLWQWSQFHGGERVVVKLLEVANVVPLYDLADRRYGGGGNAHACLRPVSVHVRGAALAHQRPAVDRRHRGRQVPGMAPGASWRDLMRLEGESTAAQQWVQADEAGASDGASPLNPVLDSMKDVRKWTT